MIYCTNIAVTLRHLDYNTFNSYFPGILCVSARNTQSLEKKDGVKIRDERESEQGVVIYLAVSHKSASSITIRRLTVDLILETA